MTKREAFLKAIHNEQVDELVWAPNFDYWLAVNSAEGTVPKDFVGMSRNDIVRAIGGTIWNRSGALNTIIDPSVKQTNYREGENIVYEIETPVGNVRQVYLKTEGSHRSHYLSEHYIKNLDDLKVMKYIAEATSFEANYAPAKQALQDTGDDGVVLLWGFSVPFIQFAKMDAGYMNGFYMWADHKEEVDGLIEAYHKQYMAGFKLLADAPGDIIQSGDNMDGVMISPAIFKEYAIPYYQEAKKILGTSKVFEGHWCGRTDNLLSITPGCGLDAVEAIVTKPMSGITVTEALDLLNGEVVMQGGIPAVLVCEEGGTNEDFERYIEKTILPLKGRKGFLLGMSDNVPPNADFERVRRVAELIA